MTDPSLLVRLARGELPRLCQTPDGAFRVDAPSPRMLLSGSFNPLHAGHRTLADLAARILQHDPCFEISLRNVDKAELRLAELRRRLAQFEWYRPVWITLAPTFAEKARLFPGATFVIGIDTAWRILDRKYYPEADLGLDQALRTIREQDGRFLVAGRQDPGGTFHPAEELAVPERYRDLFLPIRAREFRCDLSSTALRRAERGCG